MDTHDGWQTIDPAATLARARLARFLAELLCDSLPEQLERLTMPEIRAEIAGAAAALGLSPEVPGEVIQAAADSDGFAAARVRLLGHTVRSACPAYELEYGRAEVFQQTALLADLTGFYFAFGFVPHGPMAERPDHFAAEAEFLSVLAIKQVLAAHRGDAGGARVCLDAQERFLADHAGRWMPAFFERLRRADPDGPLACVAVLGQALLADWCAAFEVKFGPAWLELRPIGPEDVSISCGVPSEFVGDASQEQPGDAPVAFELGQGLASAMGQASR